MMARAKITAILALVLLIAGACLAVFPIGANGEWPSQIFENEVRITREPDHVNDRDPYNYEPVKITVHSISGHSINAADIRVTESYDGQKSSGGYAFSRINQTHLTVELPGRQGGTTVQYFINVYDEKNNAITSPTYSYRVIKNGSFQGEDFDENIDLEWGPKKPKNGENVTVRITSRDRRVSIYRADMLFSIDVPGFGPQPPGATSFIKENETTLNVTIPYFPAGTSVSFQVDAYDTYFEKVTSKYYNYEYPPLPETGEILIGRLFVILKDQVDNVGADGARVTFSNDTYTYRTESISGFASTNISVYGGIYDVVVEYRGRTYQFEMAVPDREGSFTYKFEVNLKTYKAWEEEEDRPSWMDGLGVLLLIAFTVLAYVGARKVKEKREYLNEQKKRARKGKEEVERNLFDRVMVDTGKKEIVLRTGAFLLLSLLGLFFAPFYPVWLILILAAFVTGVSLRYPYIALLILAVLVSASTSYQSTEFGWVFLVFSLIVMIGGFFDWRYAYLTFLTVFCAGLGVGFAVPLAAAVVISLFMGTVVLVTAGLFLLITAPSGNFRWLSLIPSESHSRNFVTFSREAPSSWGPVDLVNSLGDLTYVDTDILSKVLLETTSTLIPLVALLGWAAAMLAAYIILVKVEGGVIGKAPTPRDWAVRAIPGVVLLIFGLGTFLWAGLDFTPWVVIALVGVFPASLLPYGIRALGEEALPTHYGVEEKVSRDIGKRISEMVGFRKASFKEIGGLEDVKREVRNALMVPLLEPEMANKYGVKPSKGILLFGPPGCGKTLMLRAVASDLNVDMIGIKCSDVMSKWYGESEGLIAALYEEARARAPCILFLDEVDAIAKRRDFYSTDDVTPRVLSIMLSEMDGMDEAEGIIVVATTNMPDLVDPALMRPGRFDKVIYVPPPDLVSREEILRIHLKNKFTAEEIDVSGVARVTKGFSGADLANLVLEASAMKMEIALISKKPQPITTEDLLDVASDIKPSVTREMISSYDKLRKAFARKRGRKTAAQAVDGTETSEKDDEDIPEAVKAEEPPLKSADGMRGAKAANKRMPPPPAPPLKMEEGEAVEFEEEPEWEDK